MWLSLALVLTPSASDQLSDAFMAACVDQPAWILEDAADGWSEIDSPAGGMTPDEVIAGYLEPPESAWRLEESEIGIVRSLRWDGNVFGAMWFECSVSALTSDAHYAGLDGALSSETIRTALSNSLPLGEWAESGPGIDWSLHSAEITDESASLSDIDVFEAAMGDTVFIRIVARPKHPSITIQLNRQEAH